MPTFKDNIDTQISALENRLLDVELKYIAPHSNPLEPPNVYALDVQSYFVLCHAAFEEFAESLCMVMMNHIEDSFVNKKQFSKCTLCFLHFDIGKSVTVEEYDQKYSLFDHIRKQIRERKSKLSEYAMVNNHGVNIKYLRNLFLPLGLEMPTGNEKNSLEQLATLRGFYAHAHSPSRPNAVNIVAPQVAVDYVMDVLKYMNSVARKAKTMSLYIW